MVNHQASTMDDLGKSVRLQGCSWNRDELEQVVRLVPECARIEVQECQLCWIHEERMTLLLLLLQNVGLDALLEMLDPGLIGEALHSRCKEHRDG